MGSKKARPKNESRALHITLGCCGFPVPPTRYFQDFGYVEVQDVMPGMGTIRRWKREAPAEFRFAVIAPRDIGQEGYREGKITETALGNLRGVMEELGSTVALFIAPPDFAPSRSNRSQVKDFLSRVRSSFEHVVWEAPSTWDPDDALALCDDAKVIGARDPLTHGNAKGPVGYYRMPGPAGFRSRYEDPAIEKLAMLANEAAHERATYVFANVDMFADAKRFRKLLG
jgi:uncharacterized protein YecE (DUF72 family)